MPEAVNSWFENSELSIIERIEAVSEVHRNLIEGYMRDFESTLEKWTHSSSNLYFEAFPLNYLRYSTTPLNGLSSREFTNASLAMLNMKVRSHGFKCRLALKTILLKDSLVLL